MKKHFKICTKDRLENLNIPSPCGQEKPITPKWNTVPPGHCHHSCVSKILCHPHARLCLGMGAALYVKEEGNMVYIAIKTDFDTSPHPMLEASAFALYRDGFWVVAYSKDTDKFGHLSPGVKLPET